MAKSAGGQPPVNRNSIEAGIALGSGRGVRANMKPRYIRGQRKGRSNPKKSKTGAMNAKVAGAPLRGDPRRVWIPPQPEGAASRQAARRYKLKMCKALAAENGRRELPEGWWRAV